MKRKGKFGDLEMFSQVYDNPVMFLLSGKVGERYYHGYIA
jgi:hypothetical protein